MSEEKFTPGPWSWHGNASQNILHLATVDRGRTYVMSFRRWGMRGAQPYFQGSWSGRLGMVPASSMEKFEVGDRSVVGVEEAKKNGSVYRLDVSSIDHPDAHLIAASPDLYESLKEIVEEWGCPNTPKWHRAKAALAKANPAPLEAS